MAKLSGSIGRSNDAPGSVGHGYSWVPPGLSRRKVLFIFFLLIIIKKNLDIEISKEYLCHFLNILDKYF